MKVTSINDYIKRHPNSNSLFRGVGKCEEQMYKSTLSQHGQGVSVNKGGLQDKSVNKTADLKSSGFFNVKTAPSFTGTAPQKYGKFLTKLAESEKAHKVFKFIGDNAAVYEAVTALLVAGIIRPATIMALPAKEHDKEKNKKAAAHSISSGLIGLASTIILFHPIKTAVNKFVKKPEKYGVDAMQAIRQKILDNDGKPTEKLMGDFKAFWGYAPKILFAPLTAWATIALMPIIDKHVLGKFFAPKVVKAEMTPIDIYKSTSFKSNIDKRNETFQSFIGGKC